MKVNEKIDKYLVEKIIPADPEKKKLFDEFQKVFKDCESLIHSIGTKMNNIRNNFHQKEFKQAKGYLANLKGIKKH